LISHASKLEVMDWHWKLLRITEPVAILRVPAMFVIAIAKPF